MYPIPDQTKWTDEELGIPPDDEDDPQLAEPEKEIVFRLNH
jgi:hypothetical protein